MINQNEEINLQKNTVQWKVTERGKMLENAIKLLSQGVSDLPAIFNHDKIATMTKKTNEKKAFFLYFIIFH